MRRALGAAALALASACAGFGHGDVVACEALCATAAACGFLPSALGWSEDGDVVAAEENCVLRCRHARGDDATAAAIVDCFAQTGEGDASRWCDDASSPYYAAWSACKAIDVCLLQAFPGDHELQGDTVVHVQLVTFTDYLQHYAGVEVGALTEIAALYLDRPGEGGLTSCTPALCGAAQCAQSTCAGGECPTDETPECDARMCRIGELSIGRTCDELGARELSVFIREKGRNPVVQTFLDAKAGLNPDCAASTVVVDGGMYRLQPGPIQVGVRARGVATAASLKLLGAPVPAELGDADVAEFCVEFVGPPVITRAGDNEAIVPLGTPAELLALKAEVEAAGGALEFCP